MTEEILYIIAQQIWLGMAAVPCLCMLFKGIQKLRALSAHMKHLQLFIYCVIALQSSSLNAWPMSSPTMILAGFQACADQQKAAVLSSVAGTKSHAFRSKLSEQDSDLRLAEPSQDQPRMKFLKLVLKQQKSSNSSKVASMASNLACQRQTSWDRYGPYHLCGRFTPGLSSTCECAVPVGVL